MYRFEKSRRMTMLIDNIRMFNSLPIEPFFPLSTTVDKVPFQRRALL
jgi:hypothetical protein